MSVTSDAVFIFVLGGLIIFSSLTVSVALRYMRSAKRTTVVFLAHLAISNLVQGLNFLSHGLFYLWPVNTVDGCIFSQAISTATTGTYMSGIFFVYLDLYLSLKKMSVSKPVISTRLAIAMTAFCWILWLSWGLIGYGMRIMDFTYDHVAGCFIISGQFTNNYILLICLIFAVGFTGILLFHVLTYRLIQQAKLQQQSAQEAQQKNQTNTISRGRNRESQKSRWLKKNDSVLKMILIVLIMFIVCWYPLLLTTLLATYCTSCLPYLTKEVIYMTYALVVAQYVANGFIYFIKIKEFQNAVKRLCCTLRHRQIEPSATDVEASDGTSRSRSSIP